MRPGRHNHLTALALGAVLAAGGCGFQYNEPPIVAPSAPPLPPKAEGAVVIGSFENPQTASVPCFNTWQTD